MNNTVAFPTVGSLQLWADSWGGWMDENPLDRNFPYVMKKGLFHYFAYDGYCYKLVMVSEKNLQEKK